MNEQEIYKQAVTAWGSAAQRLMVIEECSELINNICKFFRGRVTDEDVLHEMVDVQLMINEMRTLIDNEEEWNKYYAFKLTRLERRLQGEENADRQD